MFWKSIILFLTGLCLASEAQAQPDSLWSRTFGGEQDDECYSLIQTADGGFAMAGYTYSFGAGEDDFWIVRTNSDGDSLWSRTFGGGDKDEAYTALIQTADGGFALAGMTSSFEVEDHAFWLVRMNADGDSLWSRVYSGQGEGDSHCFSIRQTADGGFALAGFTDASSDAHTGNFWLVRTDADGERLWSRSYGSGEGAQSSSLIQTSDGGFALAGISESFNTGRSDFLLVRTNSDGDSLWSCTYGGEAAEECYTAIQTSDGGFALVGSTNSFGAGESDTYFVRTDPNGNVIWSRTYGGVGGDASFSVIQMPDGGFAMSGFTDSFGSGESDYWLMRIGADGDSLWSDCYGGSGADVGFPIVSTEDGGYVLAGFTDSYGAGDYDFWLVKTGPDPLAVPENSLISYPSSLSLLSPYPNPFNSSVSVGFRTARAGLYSLDVVDPQGRSLGVISQGYMAAGERRVVWDAADWKSTQLPTGNYWLRLTDARGGQDVKPIVLVK